MNGIKWMEICPDSSKLSQDLREIQKTIQDFGSQVILLPGKIEILNEQNERILRALQDLNNEIKDLKKRRTDIPGTSRSNQDNIRDAFGTVNTSQKGKATVIAKPKTSEELLLDFLKSTK